MFCYSSITKYVEFNCNKVEVHNGREIIHYEKDQVVGIDHRTIQGARGVKHYYILYFDDGFKFQIARDLRLLGLFPNIHVNEVYIK